MKKIKLKKSWRIFGYMIIGGLVATWGFHLFDWETWAILVFLIITDLTFFE